MQSVLVVFFLLTSIAMVSLILLQHGKGADAGAAFGSGASATVFGATGSANFLSRTTAVLAAAWFVIAMTLGWYALQGADEPGLMDAEPAVSIEPEKVAPTTDLPDIPEVIVEETVSDVPDIPASDVTVESVTEKAESATTDTDPVGQNKQQGAE